MSWLSGHLGFVAAAYGFTAVTLGGIAAWTVLDYVRQKRAVEAAEASVGAARPGARR